MRTVHKPQIVSIYRSGEQGFRFNYFHCVQKSDEIITKYHSNTFDEGETQATYRSRWKEAYKKGDYRFPAEPTSVNAQI